MNLEWQNPNTEIPKPATVEKTKVIKYEQNLEQELSPEQVERIMAKVQDLHTVGISYSCVNIDDLNRILANGILGAKNRGLRKSLEEKAVIWKSDDIKKEWKENAQKEKRGLVFFNITGTEKNSKQKNSAFTDIANADTFRWKDVAIIFDLASYKGDKSLDGNPYGEKYDYSQEEYYYLPTNKQDNKRFRFGCTEHDPEEWLGKIPNIDLARENFFNNKDEFAKRGILEFDETRWRGYLPAVPSEYGFSLSFRVAPRCFQGVVVKFKSIEYKQIEKIISEMRKFDDDVHLLPIYDEYGNLLWPKEMGHEKIRELVTEREEDTNKEEK